jgi:hypothetical protein
MTPDYQAWKQELLLRKEFVGLLRIIEDMNIEDVVESIIMESIKFAEAMGEPYDYVIDVVLLLQARFPVLLSWRFDQ